MAKSAKKDVFRVVLVAFVFICAAFILKQPYVRDQLFDIHALRARFKGTGMRGIGYFVVFAAIANGFGVPRLWISAGAGSLYGALGGTLIAEVSTLLGASFNFLAGRSLLRGPFKRRMPRRMRVWYDRFNANGFRWILYVRFFPFLNATLTNLMCGVSKVRYGVFIAATAIGYLPFTVALATLGSSAVKQNWMQLVVGLLVFGSVFIIQRIAGRKADTEVVDKE
jgi:uncharacterized membrane protein YdjX (TVP38/TMEM64 family)